MWWVQEEREERKALANKDLDQWAILNRCVEYVHVSGIDEHS